MSLAFKHKIFRRYLRVEISGERTPGSEVRETLEIWKEIAKIAVAEDRMKILTIMKISGRLPMDSAFQVAKSAELIGWRRNFKLAVVAPRKSVLVNLGYEVKMFSSYWRGKRWLLSSRSVLD